MQTTGVATSRLTEVDDLEILQLLDKASDGSTPAIAMHQTISSDVKTASWCPHVVRYYVQRLLYDTRNDCFVLFIVLMLVSVLPSAVWLMLDFAWWRGFVHVVLVLQFVGTFTAILHNTSHRKMSPYAALNGVVPYLLTPLFGQTWNTYYYHHVKHHHVEDNGPNDLSSTLRFQRDSFLDFSQYFLRFLFFVALELPMYFIKRAQYWNAFATFGGEVMSFTVAGFAIHHNMFGGIVVFFIPLIVVRFGMMSSNWAQHSFLDPSDPKCNYKSSVTCVRHSYNKEAFNDGYHTSHHLNARRHWSEHPTHLIKELSTYYEKRPIVFQQLGFMNLWLLLMLQNYKRLAELYVHLGPVSERPSESEIIALLKSRTRAFTEQEVRHFYPTLPSQRTKVANRSE